MGFAQNMAQCEGAIQVNNNKRKRNRVVHLAATSTKLRSHSEYTTEIF